MRVNRGIGKMAVGLAMKVTQYVSTSKIVPVNEFDLRITSKQINFVKFQSKL